MYFIHNPMNRADIMPRKSAEQNARDTVRMLSSSKKYKLTYSSSIIKSMQNKVKLAKEGKLYSTKKANDRFLKEYNRYNSNTGQLKKKFQSKKPRKVSNSKKFGGEKYLLFTTAKTGGGVLKGELRLIKRLKSEGRIKGYRTSKLKDGRTAIYFRD